LLGEFSLTLDDRPVTSLAGDRPVSLLAYLLLHRQAPQSRQQIAFTLWPDSSDSQARTNLRNLFFTLRQTLPDADAYLAADSMTLQWRPDAVLSLDVANFETALAEAKTAVHPPDKIAHLETAVSLYKGDLLPGNYDDWIIPLREELRQNYLDALHQLVTLLEQQPDYRAATRYSQRLLQQDPLDETAYVQLMRLHALSGDRAGVRRAYETCAATLRRELDVAPGPATQAAYEELLRLEVAATAASPLPAVAEKPAQPRPAPSRPRPLPVPATPFIGRETELAHTAELLADPLCRLLTIVGPGGIGKTRLALETAVGHQPVFPDGVAFIDLTPIHTADLVATTIAQALALTVSDLSAHQSQLVDYLGDKTLLLVLDNMEHLLEAAGVLTEILAGAPEVKILVTSRQRLELAEEWVFDLPGLPLPDAGTPPADNSAVALFLQTAQRTNRLFMLTEAEETAVIRICHLVGGMPLGLQLAATWVRVLSCAEIAQEIERDLDFLSSSQRHLPERQRSMRAVFDYSWQLLVPAEQAASCRLAIFCGGFTWEAAEAAGASLPILSSLVDKALVNRVGDGRYGMHELVRQYMVQKLQATPSDGNAVHCAHATYYQTLAATAHARLQGAEGMQWLAQLDAEIDNFRTALSWALENQEIELGLQLAGALWRFWWWRGHWREGLAWLEKFLSLTSEMSPLPLPPAKTLATAYQGAGVLARNLGNYLKARSFYQQSLAIHHQEGNLNGEAAALNSLGTLAMFEANYPEAESYFNQSKSLYEQTGNKRGREAAVNNLGIVAMYQGDYERARVLHEENLVLSREEGNPAQIASALGNLGDVFRYLGAFDLAEAALAESLQLLREINNKQALATTLYGLGRLALDIDDVVAAAAYFQESLSLYRETQDPVAVADVVEGVAILAGKRERPFLCAQLFGAAEAIRQLTGTAVPHSERAAHQQIQVEMVTAVGETAFQEARQRGQQMTLLETLAAALSWLEKDAC
jgi:predicted ATPase/DNA-binding SARP family transcriptional activator